MTGTGLPATAAIAGLLSLLVLQGPWGIGEAWPAVDRLAPLALLWGAVLGLPRACRSPEAALPSMALGFGWALPALAGAWVLDGAGSPLEVRNLVAFRLKAKSLIAWGLTAKSLTPWLPATPVFHFCLDSSSNNNNDNDNDSKN